MFGQSNSDSLPAYIKPNNQNITVTPTVTQQVFTVDQDHTGLGTVTVNAVTSAIDNNISSENIADGITILGVTGNATVLNGDTLSVTPSTSAQILTPTSPKNGFTQVSISAVTSTVDQNITTENIKKDVTILGVTGSYEGSGGGDVVNAKNFTGSTVSTGDKVWLKYETQLAGANADETTTTYNICPCLSADGKCFTYSVNSTTSGIKYINSIDDADFSIVTSSGLYQSSNYTSSRPMFVRYTEDNRLIRNTYAYTHLIGQNWWQVSSKNYIGYDFAISTNSYGDTKLYFIDINSGAEIKTINLPAYVYSNSTIAVSPTEIYLLRNGSTSYYYVVDRENNSATKTDFTINGMFIGSGSAIYPLGITKDGKYIITTGESSPATNQYLQIIEVASSTNLRCMNAQEVIPEMQYWMSHSAPYAFTFNQNTGVLCCAELNSKKYGFYRYDSTTHKWSVLNISLAGALDGIDVFYGPITVDENLSRAMVAYKPSGSSAIYSRLFALRSEIGFSAIAYDWADISPSMFSGKVVTGGASQENIEVATVLPDELTVNVTVNIDNAEISGGIE